MGLEIDKEKLAVTVAQYFSQNYVTGAAVQPLVIEARSIFLKLYSNDNPKSNVSRTPKDKTRVENSGNEQVNYSSSPSDIRTMDNYLKTMEVADLDAELEKDDVNALVYVINEILRSNSYEEESVRIIRLLDGKKNSPPSTVIEIITNVQSEQNVITSFHNDDSKELEKSNREYKESSPTQTSSSSSVLHKRKASSYASSSNGVYRTLMANQMIMLNRPKRNQISSTTQRILSAKFLRVKQLQSELIEARKKITDLQSENRTLKIIYRRQDSALRKYESQESYLPQLLKSHEEEMRVLTSKYKKIRGAYNDLESRYNRQFTELTSVRDRYKHLLQISQDKHLLERERLTKQIEEMKIVVNDLKNKIKLQSRRLDLEVKNCKYQLTVEFQKQRTLREQLKQLQDAIEKMKNALEEKERFIAVCQMNHHVINRTSQTKLNNKTAMTNSLKATRNQASTGNVEGQDKDDVTTTKEMTLPNNTDEKSEPPIASTNKIASPLKIKVEQTEPSTVCSNVTAAVPEIKTHLQIVPTNWSGGKYRDNSREEKSIEIVVKADSNNNRKLNSLVDVNYVEPLKAARVPRKSQSLESFEECEKTLRDEETSSEKSDDFEHVEDAVSWLEVHEKSNDKEIVESTSSEDSSRDSQTLLFSSNFNDIVERTRSAISLMTHSNSIDAKSHDSHSNTPNSKSIPVERKTALLKALEAIDLGSKETPSPPPRPSTIVNKFCPPKTNITTSKLKKKVN